MGRPATDFTGRKLGLLTVLSRCGSEGKYPAWKCECSCGSEIVVSSQYLRTCVTPSCGCYQKAPWNRGVYACRRHFGQDGYARVRQPDHPNAWPNGIVLEHVLVVSRYLGRALLPHENVHHKNGDRADNRLENLELWSKAQPAGQRVSDKVLWAREILALYGGLYPEEAE